MVLLETGLYIIQFVYIKSVSCDDAIFATQAKYVHNGSSVFKCLCDMQKVFDSVEYCVLPERLFSVGVK